MIDAMGAPQSLLVLGGGSDIALATARRLVGDRVRTVYLAGRRPERLAAAAEELRRLGATTVETLPFDADRVETHQEFVDGVFGRGDVDVVLLAFGVLGDQQAAEKDPAVAVEMARTNYLGAVSVGLAVANRLREQGQGALVVLSSVAAERPRRSNYLYGSTKAGLDAFATGLGDALRGTGVRVMVVRPGFVVSRMTEGLKPAPLATSPEAVAEAIVGGLRRGAETVWVPATLRLVMTVLRHLPRAVFRRLPV